LLPFEQLAHGPVHPEGLLAIEIGLQTGRDFANQAAEAHKALQLGIVGHSRPPDELAASNATVLLRATGGHRRFWGEWIAEQSAFMTVKGRQENSL
jgi:hypothetical protein